MYQVTVYTDGACSNNGDERAVGAWCAILQYQGHEKEIHGIESGTTNNRMELRAVIEAVKSLKSPSEVVVITDSQYVCVGAANMRAWIKSGKPHANMDMWRELIDAGNNGKHRITFQHVKGHAGHPENERCDTIARSAVLVKKLSGK